MWYYFFVTVLVDLTEQQDYKEQIERLFKAAKDVHCPAFDCEKIVFNAKGINHLIFKGNRSRREESRILTNIRLLPLAIKVLRNTSFWQEENLYPKDGVEYRFWCFEAVVENRRIKVIVRQVGQGNKHFWSVIPAWRRDRFGLLNAKSRNLGVLED